MSNMLNFKYGLHSNLPSQISNGTIYVTTDEKAMYVDLGNNRIRLSSVINCTYAEWTQLKPPYSTEALYYITDKNALVKYSKDNGDDQWIQINSTADIDNLLAGLGFYFEAPDSPKHGDILVNDDGTVSIYDTNAEGVKWVSYGTVGSKLIDLSSRVAALETTIATHGTDITNLKAKDVELATDIADTRTAIGFLGKKTSLPETGTLGQSVLVDGKVYIWVAAEGETAAGWKEISSLGKRVEDLKARIEDVALAAGDKTAVETLQTNLNTLSNAVNHADTGLAKTYEIAKGAADDLLAYKNAHAEDYDNEEIDGAIAAAGALGTAASQALEAYKKVNDEAVAAIAGRVKTLEDAGFVKADGSVVMTGDLDLGGKKIVEVASPVANTDAANKIYVDTEVGKANTAASNAQGAADAASQAAAAADAKGAQGIADAAAALAEAQKKTTMADVEAKGYAVAETVNGQFSTLKGSYEGTLADLNTAAGNAQTTATNAANAAAAITEGATAKTIAEVETRIGLIEQANAKLDETYATDDELDAKEASILGTVTNEETGEVSNFNGTVKGAYEAATDAAGAAATAAQKGQQGIDDAATALAKANEKTTMAEVEAKGYATGTELTNAVAAARGVTTETVASVDAKVGGHETRLADLEKGVDDLEKDLLSKVQTADAMIYRGTVANEGELATKSEALGGAHIGDTYKATAEFTMTNNTKVNIGDLLIASGTEENGVITTATLTWDHVPSGYVANYNPTLSTVTSATNVVDVNLTSAHAAEGTSGDLGDFQISADTGSAVTVRVSEGNNIAIGMTWGTF